MNRRSLLPILLLFVAACSRSHDDIAGKADLVVRDATAQLQHTDVSAVLAVPHAPNTSILWCATMQLAWDQLPGVIGGPVTLQGSPPLIADLNKSPFPPGDLDASSYVAVAGKMPAILATIKDELARKFHGGARPGQLPAGDDSTIAAYAYLFKNLEFDTPLTRLKSGVRFTASDSTTTPVQAFGVNETDTRDWDKCAAQVIIWRDEADDDFVIELKAREANDRLLIARLEPGATLKDTTDAILAAAGAPAPKEPLTKQERVTIPVLNFDITRSYDEVVGLSVTTPGTSGLYLSYAKQNIRFRLDERGAVLKSEGGWGVKSAVPDKGPRSFVCDGPFAVVLLRKDASTPYFAAWVDNPEILIPQR